MKNFGMMLTYFLILIAAVSLMVSEMHAAEILVVRVDGLSCAFCAYSLEENLKDLEGVEEVDINLSKGTASLTLSEGTRITDEAINKAVEESGFTPRSITRAVE